MDGNNDEHLLVLEKTTSDRVLNQVPERSSVLIVDSDRICLRILEQMLKHCHYEVTKCQTAREALSMVQEKMNKFDIVICDLYMSDMNGITFLDDISAIDKSLPVVMVSSDNRKEIFMECMMHGACDYLIKPIKIEAVDVIWKNVLRKKMECLKDLQQRSGNAEDCMLQSPRTCTEDAIPILPRNKGNAKSLRKRKEMDEGDGESSDDQAPNSKKQRLIWTVELHQNFVAAVNQLGGDKAVPKKILERMHAMGFTEITRENVASHLQKYRLYLQKQNSPSYQNGDPSSSMESRKFSIFEQASSLMGSNLRSCASSRPYPAQHACAPSSPFLAQSLVPSQAAGFEQASAYATNGLPLVDQGNYHLEPRTPEPSCIPLNVYSMNNFPLRNAVGVNLAYTNDSSAAIPSQNEELLFYRSMGNVAEQARPLLIDDDLIYEPSFLLRQYQQDQEQDEIFGGQFE